MNPLDRILRYCLEHKLVVALLLVAIVAWGVLVAPFPWKLGELPRDPVAVDAIPDIGENQQIVFTKWPGRSPQDVEDQITYPLTVALLGIDGVKTVRSLSMFGFSSIYVIFEDDVEFYWSRSRLLEKLSSLPMGTLPGDASPTLGPDATALGQVFWYTLEGRDADGRPTGGWDLHELRSIQDWYVRYALSGVTGVAEVASVGGFVQEYQIDVDPDAMRAFGITLEQVFSAVRESNADVGARTIEVNRVEYVVRGVGFLNSLEDIERTVVAVRDNVPVYVKDVANVGLGPALRRGALDKSGAEAVGGVVVVRYGENPLATIDRVKERIDEIAASLPRKTLVDGTSSQVAIVPFYDRTGLIHETLGTLEEAIRLEVLITILVVLVMVYSLAGAGLISALLPLAVLMSFIGMKVFGVDANVVALSGIAIAIGTMVDMGVILTENMLRGLREAEVDGRGSGEDDLGSADPDSAESAGDPIATLVAKPPGSARTRFDIIFESTREVSGAVLTAVATTVVSFLPVFTMEGPEGKLFKPLAYTKTFALVAALLVALTVLPALAQLVLGRRIEWSPFRRLPTPKPGGLRLWDRLDRLGISRLVRWLVLVVIALFLTHAWLPLGPEKGFLRNAVFLFFLVGGLLWIFSLFVRVYPRLLAWSLDHKAAFLAMPLFVLLLGFTIWQGAASLVGWMPGFLRQSAPVVALTHAFSGLGKEFMPDLDEGSFLYMPTTMPHASIGEAADVLAKLDMAIQTIPEVESVVGKLGRAESSLDPAPVSMIETVINYKSEYKLDAAGRRLRFAYRNGDYVRDEHGELVPDRRGRPYRQWRDDIHTVDDIWQEIVAAARIPGTTSAPKLQPIAARIVMLQSGMRAPLGIKVKGPDLDSIEVAALAIERVLEGVPAIAPGTVVADRIVGKPYLEIHIDREAIARYGIRIRDVQDVIEVAIGGRSITTTVEGRERYSVRVRYQRELRDSIETLGEILVASSDGAQIPLAQLSEIRYVRGPQVIKSEDTFLVGYVLFDKREVYSEVETVEQAGAALLAAVDGGELSLPEGVSYTFAGSYENQLRSERRLKIVLPLALLIIFLLLYLQFSSVATTLMVFSGIFVAWAGGFIMIWLYGQGWFLDFDVFGSSMRELFQIHPIHLSVAIWVGFIALFGIASDDGVVMATYLRDVFRRREPSTIKEIRSATMEAGRRRVRPCMMTTATTVLALLPVLSSTGKGSDIMVPMAIPVFGGMLMALLSQFVVPVLYSAHAELAVRFGRHPSARTTRAPAPDSRRSMSTDPPG